MTLDNFITGLQIIRKYFKKDGYHIGAEHDQFYVYQTDLPMLEGDVASLFALGWFQPDNITGEYDPQDGWSIWT